MPKKITFGGINYEEITGQEFPVALIKLRPSMIVPGEIGVFAIRELSKGTIIGRVSMMNEEFFITHQEYEKIDEASRNEIKNFCVSTPDGFFVPRNINYLSIPWYMNHSCDGNVGHDANGNYVTIRLVKENEELSLDFGLAMSWQGFGFSCSCLSKNCRKSITGNNWLDEEYVKRNYKHMAPEIKELIKKRSGL